MKCAQIEQNARMNIEDSYNRSQLVWDWGVVDWTSITLPGSMRRATSGMTNEKHIRDPTKLREVTCENSITPSIPIQ